MTVSNLRMWYVAALLFCYCCAMGCGNDGEDNSGGLGNEPDGEISGESSGETIDSGGTQTTGKDMQTTEPDGAGTATDEGKGTQRFVYSGHNPVWLNQGWSPDETRQIEPMSDKEYAAARKRMRRTLLREFPKGLTHE